MAVFAGIGTVAAAMLAAAAGVLCRRSRTIVAVLVMMGVAYDVSARRLAGTLAPDALWLVPVFAMALFIAWPRLTPRLSPRLTEVTHRDP